MTRLSERPFSERLEALYKSRSFQLAVAVAETEQVSGPCRSQAGVLLCNHARTASYCCLSDEKPSVALHVENKPTALPLYVGAIGRHHAGRGSILRQYVSPARASSR